jgi:hypothetical protein
MSLESNLFEQLKLYKHIKIFILMPALNQELLLSLQDDYTKYTCFIETGTFIAETIRSLEPYFDKLYTIEFSEKYYNYSKGNYDGDKINFMLGDSSVVLKELLPTITDKCIFFLDGHWSGGDTGKSEKHCPLYEEVAHINNLYNNEAIIIIDDFRLFGLDSSSGKLGEDWRDINKDNILNILSSRIKCVYHLDSVYEKDDRLIIHINEK